MTDSKSTEAGQSAKTVPSRPAKPVELLAPAGDAEKLEIAVHYGADAVYLSDDRFSLRNFARNFTVESLPRAVARAHERGVKVYAACNLFPRDDELDRLAEYLETLGRIGPDGLIVADPGVVAMAAEIVPRIPVHLSTQANTVNSRGARFWEGVGVRRINVARELSLREIRTIAERTDLEIEAFVHGAMCIAYSGRCLLSSFMAGRESNRGACCQPCRFLYTVMEETRPGRLFPLAEDDRGSYVFNSRDLCMIDHLPEMIAAGIGSLKIEGRMKGIHYVGTAVKVYREALDALAADPGGYAVRPRWRDELAKISQRDYCTGFYLGDPAAVQPNYDACKRDSPFVFAGKAMADSTGGRVDAAVRNRLRPGDRVEVLSRKGPVRSGVVEGIEDGNKMPLTVAQPGSRVWLIMDRDCLEYDLIRRVDVK